MSRFGLTSTVCMCVILACTIFTVSSVSHTKVTLINNEYHDIVIAIEDNVPEDKALLDKIQEVFTDASAFLCEITRYRAYFKSITILVPKSWTDDPQYETHNYETYETSDIRIDDTDHDGPYVMKPTPCGEVGDYMHLTADYLMDSTIADSYGIYSHVIVHEWGHLRYGVYDEYPGGNTGAPYFYSSGSGDIEATRCSTAVTGVMKNKVTGADCVYINNYPEDDCRFYDSGSFTGSLMYRQYLSQLIHFCDNETFADTLESIHNVESPSKQNRLCEEKSVWEIMREHVDFADGANPPGAGCDATLTLPEFRIVKQQGSRIALVLDVSGRLVKGIEVVQDGDSSRLGGCLVVVSDGEENTSPYIYEVIPTLIAKGICVDVIAFSEQASLNLELLPTSTGGRAFFYSESATSNALNEAFATIATRGKSALEQAVPLYSNTIVINGYDTSGFSFDIDASIGMDTEFLFNYLQYTAIEVTVHTPNGSTIDKDSSFYNLDSTFKLIRIKIPGIAEVGTWTVSISNPSSSTEYVGVIVQSKSSTPGEYPITVTSEWSANTITPPEKLRLYATVSKGIMPVLNAHVVATVERPSGDSVQLIMTDNGGGADITKDDGVYSSYFTAFAGSDRYSVKVEVTNTGGDTVISPSRVVGFGSLTNPDLPSTGQQPEDESTGKFQRAANGGSVTCDGSTACSGYYDLYPPAKIVDLQVTKVSYEDRGITLQFTAPGDDLDFGNATAYEIWMHTDFSTMSSNHEDTTNTTQDHFVEGVLSSPQSPGETETFTIVVPNQGEITYVFCVVAIDDGGNKSPRSNIVSASMKYFPQTNYLVVVLIISAIVIVLIAIFITTLICMKKKYRVKQGTVPVA
ncbi:calcium-activated chloride channel regulator 1-like [Saccoglossus kowalevskii]|uniref:Calcium-activated chloride channel regulator 4-like n=1 Tax=Saccoglossus kowalevskii TaxID=10224 RepID=A0ABM0M016_SACKO|nr:PREDICTED: calcium-activated chloride channel regulator 4-like [Saccoglossus kowalevskii]